MKLQRITYTCWILTATALIATEIYYTLLRPNPLPTALYEATHRIILTCFFGWMILSFHHLRSGGAVRWFFAHPLWQPIAKLSLSIYLVHDFYIIMSVANTKELKYFDVSWMVHIIIGDIVISIIFGFILYILIEAPIAKLLNYFLKWDNFGIKFLCFFLLYLFICENDFFLLFKIESICYFLSAHLNEIISDVIQWKNEKHLCFHKN